MFKPCFMATVILGGGAFMPSLALSNTPVWDSWQPIYTATPYRPELQPRRAYTNVRQGNPAYRQTAYAPNFPPDNGLACGYAQALDLPDRCITKSDNTRHGLQTQLAFLRNKPLQQRVASLWANVSNAALLETARELLAWHDGIAPGTLQERFFLRELQSDDGRPQAKYTGYYTPMLAIRPFPGDGFNIPIYRRPHGKLAQLSHDDIINHGLSGRGLEVAWTNDHVGLFYAQMQGSSLAVYPDGREVLLEYDGTNDKPFFSIADAMKARGIRLQNYGNDAIREWLYNNPQYAREILTANPRYVFFNVAQGKPTTASGTPVITGHTIAVDPLYIPFGSVLLAEVPVIDRNGNERGQAWRLLFAQDQGSKIKGAGRIDLYTGPGKLGENVAHRITGYRKTYLLVRRPGYGKNTAVAHR